MPQKVSEDQNARRAGFVRRVLLPSGRDPAHATIALFGDYTVHKLYVHYDIQ